MAKYKIGASGTGWFLGNDEFIIDLHRDINCIMQKSGRDFNFWVFTEYHDFDLKFILNTPICYRFWTIPEAVNHLKLALMELVDD